jgi:hypothetical protein
VGTQAWKLAAPAIRSWGHAFDGGCGPREGAREDEQEGDAHHRPLEDVRRSQRVALKGKIVAPDCGTISRTMKAKNQCVWPIPPQLDAGNVNARIVNPMNDAVAEDGKPITCP